MDAVAATGLVLFRDGPRDVVVWWALADPATRHLTQLVARAYGAGHTLTATCVIRDPVRLARAAPLVCALGRPIEGDGVPIVIASDSFRHALRRHGPIVALRLALLLGPRLDVAGARETGLRLRQRQHAGLALFAP